MTTHSIPRGRRLKASYAVARCLRVLACPFWLVAGIAGDIAEILDDAADAWKGATE